MQLHAVPDDGQLAVGDVLDSKYVIEGLIGRGGMGAVYRARHVRLDSPRAIKLMRTELARDEELRPPIRKRSHASRRHTSSQRGLALRSWSTISPC